MQKIMFLDVDGTLTDGKIYMAESGELFKAFDIKDGCAIHDIMPRYGIIPVVITARMSQIVENRCKELGIVYYYQGVRNKANKLREIMDKFGVEKDNKGKYLHTAYIGDDIIDIPCMELCCITGCPKDAAEPVKVLVDYISEKDGGYGAVRDFTEWLIRQKF